jgi:hypothetical protein
MDELIWYS